ncbi:MAG: formate dehydrogenase accessory sulfurtransferase FdhD [Fulvivirga sp.]
MQHQRVASTQVLKKRDQKIELKEDLLAAEEPLEIRLIYGTESDRKEESIAVTMRTPGHDFELALGFLFTEGVIKSYKDIHGIKHCQQVKSPAEMGNVVKVSLQPETIFDQKKLDRNFYTTSSCGVCGKGSIEALQFRCNSISSDLKISEQSLMDAPDKMRKEQAIFEHTGGLHAAALFSADGAIVMLREDIGRHNALDKLIGAAISTADVPLTNHFAVVSGRIGFELVQKSIAAGLPILGAVGAPSSLAVALAKEYNLTIAGFIKNGNYNIYTGEERIV